MHHGPAKSSETAVVLALAFRVVLVLVAWPRLVCAQTTVNMSHDLVALGIAGQNMVPDSPALDSRPLFQAAIEYAHTHSVERMTVDTGADHFLTLEAQDRYTDIYGLSDLEIDFAGSQVFFKAGFHQGFAITYCNRLTLSNLTIDYLEPPYTHVQVSAVDAPARRLFYAPLPGWPSPTTLNNAINPYGAIDFWAAVFRNGTFVPGTSRMRVAGPLVDGSIQLVQDQTPWTQPATLSTLQAGDTLVVTGRGGGPPVIVWRGDEVVLSNITVYGSSTWAINVEQSINSVGDGLRVMPRPGVGLVGSNADGIHFARSLHGNVLRNSYVTRTLDDGIAMDSLEVATAPQRIDARHLRVNRFQYNRFPNGTALNFVDPASTLEIPGATIVDQTPADSTQPAFGEIVDLTVDRDLPAIPAGWKVVYGAPTDRGAGSIIEDNRVEEVTGRNIWVSGTHQVTIRRNRVGAGSSGGIVISNELLSYPGPPVHDLVVDSNIMLGNIGPMAQESGSQNAIGAIMISTADNNAFALSHNPSNSGVSITNNFIADSGRAGVWVGELSGGEVRDNIIVRWNARPDLPYWGMNAGDEQIARDDATLAVAVRFSENVDVTGNTTDLTSTLTGPVQLTPSSIALGRNAFQGSIAVQSMMANLSWAARSNKAWLTVDETPHTGTGSVNYAVAENTTGSTRTGRITIAGVAFLVTQTSMPAVEAVSVTPNTGSGVTQSFTLAYSDSAGVAADLSGAMVRFTNDANPALMCTIHHRATTGQVRIMDDLGVWGPSMPYGSGTLSNGQCALNLATSSATPSGNDLTLALNITFLSTFAGPATISMRAQSLSGPNTGWLPKGTWTAGALVGAISITPNSGIGITRTFDAAFTDSLGVSADLKRAMVRFGASTVNGCVVDYNAITATVRLFDDAGVPGTPASFGPGTLTNSQCTLDLSQSSAAPSGPNLMLTLRVIFNATFVGQQPILMRAMGNVGNNTGWLARGTWDVGTDVQAISVTPNAGSAPTQTFVLAFSDAAGVTADLAAARVRFRSPSGQQCGISYNAMTNLVRVQDDAGNFGAFTPLGSGTIDNNSQCSLDLTQSSAARSGTDLTLTLRLTFKPAFAGTKSIDMRANSNVGSTTGWLLRGTWTLPGVVSVSPSSGTELSQTFTMRYSGPFGTAGLMEPQVRFGAGTVEPTACTARFNQDAGTIELLDDAGTSWQSGTLGSGMLGNSQCTLNLAESEATVTGTDLTLVLKITFGSSFMGPKSIYLAALVTGQNTGWILTGMWNLIPDLGSPGPIDLGTLGGYGSNARKVNAGGQIVGTSDKPRFFTHPVMWTTSGLVDMGTLGGGEESVSDVNDAGQAVGSSRFSSASANRHAFVWTQAGGMVDLGTLPGDVYSDAHDVNENGQVIGYSYHVGANNLALSHPFLWTQADGMVDLGTLFDGPFNFANGINASGQVVGGSYPWVGVEHAFSWTKAGGMVDLGALDGLSTAAIAVNDSGLVIGTSVYAPNPWEIVYHAFVWTQGSGMVPLGTLGGVSSRVIALNENGVVVGDSQNSAGKHHAFAWTPEVGMVDLGTLGGDESYAVAVNANGDVVGWSNVPNGARHPFLWTQADGMIDLGALPGSDNSSAVSINDQCQIVGYSYFSASLAYRATMWNAGSCAAVAASRAQ